MISFLFEQYGYYPQNFVDNCFSIGKWQFGLIEVDLNEKEIEKMDSYNKFLRSFFEEKGMYFIKNKSKSYISFYGGKNYVLVCCYKYMMEVKSFKRFCEIFFYEEYQIDLISLREAWKIRMVEIESKGIGSLKMESCNYRHNLEKVLFCLGMTQNAIQYLNDYIYDYGSIIKNAVITHKRVNDLSSFDFFNPFNFVVDSRIRDYVELYRNGYIFFDEIVDVFLHFRFDVCDASLFLARLLYPANVFDVMEDIVDGKMYDYKIEYDTNKELLKIKKVYLFFREKYNIHPILWLENLNFI